MRIISSFHDYYDCGMKHGVDKELVYLREPKKIKLPPGANPGKSPLAVPLVSTNEKYYLFEGTGLTIDSAVVGFCGKMYPLISLKHEHRGRGTQTKHCQTPQEVDEFLATVLKSFDYEYYNMTRHIWRHANRASFSWYTLNKGKVEEFFALTEKFTTQLNELLNEHRAPILVVTEEGPFINGNLKNVGFFRVMDPFTAYQEIRMYLGGMAAPEKTIPHVSDEDMLLAKGFDKWSFKKPPSGKKRKKK